MAGDLIPEFDRRVRELANQTLRLREDLILAPGFTAGPDSYSIEDPLTGKFYYLGPREFAFVNRLDGTTSLGEILRQTASRSDQALTQVEAATLCRWLIDQQLVRTSSPLRHEATESRSTAPPAAARFNPLACKLPVLDPDRLLAHLERSWGWVFGRTALIGWLGAVGCALAQLAAKSNQLADASQGILATDNWLWLGCCWLILKFIHELAHGIVCKRYSGNVREAGVLLVLFTPVAYVDITSAWRFRSKWQRIHVALAGMYAELLLASAATCLWAWSTDERVRDIALNVMIMASITTLAFNANPLLKFDGYYVLADWLEVPNLAANGTRIWAGWLRWFILGLPSPPAALPARQRQIVAVYGLASLVWRTLVTLSLVLAASVLFAGAGIVLAVIGAAIWWLIPLVQALRSIWAQRFGRVSWVRCGIASTLLGGGLVSLFTVIPWTGPHRAPAVVEFAPLEVVRANSSGFVAHLHVRTGDTVRRGDHLVTLHNPDLVRELEELDVQIRQAQLKSHMLQREGKLAEYQAERDRLASLDFRRSEKQVEVAALTVRAGCDGMVMSRRLATLMGTYLAEGDEILAIGRAGEKELRVSIAQRDVPSFAEHLDQPLQIRLDGGESLAAPLHRLDPQASTTPPHPALGAHCQGPIPVVESRERDARQQERIEHIFLAPRVVGTVPLPASAGARLFSGQLGEVHFRTYGEAFGVHVLRLSRDWIDAKLKRLTAEAHR